MCYEVLVQEKLEVQMPDTETKPHVMRLGWSVDSPTLAVGEAPLSYGYGGTGRSSVNNKFSYYGEPYSTGDVITCYIDLDSNPKAIFFAKNGKYLDVAFRLGPEADGKVFFPHVSVKNMRFVANFGAFDPYFPPIQGFCFIQHLPPQLLRAPLAAPRDRRECEVLMMIGLPSCGKTTWLEKYVKEHPEKKYNILGTNDILVKMKVMGLGRKRNYHGRWDALIKQATGILNEMLKIAKHKNRNYILDQTNVYQSARRRKMGNFHGYRRIAVVLVNENSVLMQRNAEVVRRDGKVVPESAFMEMKSNFTLPVQGEIFDDVWYIEENKERSQHLVREFNEEGRRWKEEQKKRPNDDVPVKTEPGTDVKRQKYGDSADRSFTNQSGGNYRSQGVGGRHSDSRSATGDTQRIGSYPQHFNQEGTPNIPVPASHARDTRREDYQQPKQTAYPERQQYNPPYHGRTHSEQASNYGKPGRNNLETDSHSHGFVEDGSRFPTGNTRNNQRAGREDSHGVERPHQGQWRNIPSHRDVQGHQGDQIYSNTNAGNSYNQPPHPRGDWGFGGAYHELQGNNRDDQRGGHSEVSSARGYSGNTYQQPDYPHRNQNDNYSRGGNDISTRGDYSRSSQGYPVKQESPTENYPTVNQQGGYDYSQNRPGPGAYNESSRGHHDSLRSWNAPHRGGFNNQSQGHWSGGQGLGSAPGSQGYGTSQPNVQSARQDYSNRNQQFYHQGQSQNFHY